jgi:PAS domain S-box-containing protein
MVEGEELRRLEEAAGYFQFAGVIMVAIDRDENVSAVNDLAGEVLGYPRDEIVGRNWFDHFLPDSHREDVRAAFRKLMAGEVDPVEYFDNPIVTRTGEERMVEWHNRLLRDAGGSIIGTLSSGSDITDRLRMARELVERQSLTRLGEMAAVVAHEVRNPLAGISASMQNMADTLPAESPHRPIIAEIRTRIRSLADIIDDLLLYARPLEPKTTPLRILDLLAGVANAVRRDPAHAKARIEIGGDDLVVRADPRLLHQAFLNLLLNAAQALPGEGRLAAIVAGDGDRLRVRITDDGPGIPAELRERVFEPFFTTRGRGTGLGLPTARRILRSHGGDLRIEEAGASGTALVAILPAEAVPPPR